MIGFLMMHFRYNTMNSWNGSTSYANNMKVHRVIPRELQDRVFELMDIHGFYDKINWLIEDWDENQSFRYQANFNGKSGGYLVIYNGYIENKTIFSFDNPINGQDYADGYGWMDIEEAKILGFYKKKIKRVGCYPGKSIDQDEDFSEWDMDSIKERVRLVQSFDRLCDDIVNLTIDMAKNASIEEEKYTEKITRKRIVYG